MQRLPETKYAMLIAAFERGLSIRAAARAAGVDRKTATRHFRRQDRIICPCGRALPHKGWCSFRVARSPARQAVVRRIAQVTPEQETEWSALRPKPKRRLPQRHYVGNFDLKS